MVFAWPGVGRLIVDSIFKNDFPMVQASIIVLAASIAIVNLLVDVSYRLIDPRIRRGPPDGGPGGGGGVGPAARPALAALAGALHPRRDRADAARGGRGRGLAGAARPEFINLGGRLEPPVFVGGTWDYFLGTDDVGATSSAGCCSGARISLIVVGIVVPGAALLGTLLGLIAGWVGGLTGQLLMRFVDVQLAMPAILFAVLLASLVGPSLRNVIIILLIWTWPSYARLVRADVLSLKERDFVTASRATGAGPVWIMRRHLFPNVVNTVVIIMTLEVALVILAEAALSFLTVGAPPGTPSWG